MGMPEYPTRPEIDVCDALTDVIETIAVEELAIAHFINAEAEKVQALAGMMEGRNSIDCDDVIRFQKGVAKVMRTVIKKQMLLQFKFEDAIDALKDCDCCNGNGHSPRKK